MTKRERRIKKRILGLGIIVMMGVSAPISDYVVDLINQMGGNATEENYESNLSYIKDNYEEIKKISGVKMNLVHYYINIVVKLNMTSTFRNKKMWLNRREMLLRTIVHLGVRLHIRLHIQEVKVLHIIQV